MRAIVIILFFFGLTISRQALAADASLSTDVACVVDQFTPEESRLLVDVLYKRANSERRTAIMQRFGDAFGVCGRRYGWDTPRQQQVSIMIVAALAARETAANLARDGVDVAAVDRWFERQNDQFKVGAFIDMNDDQAWAILYTLAGQEISRDLMERDRNLIRNYIQSKAATERNARGLPDPPER